MSKKTYEMICEHCGQEYTAKSAKSKYCGQKCRTAAHRIRNIKASPVVIGDKLELLMVESEKILKEIDKHLLDIRTRRNIANAWIAIDDLRDQNRVIVREIADLLSN